MIRRQDRKGKRGARKRRIRAKVSGTTTRPRLSVFRSLRGFFVQAIDDEKGRTLASASMQELRKKAKNTVEGARQVGELLADRLEKLKVKSAVLDRSGYRYHGKVKAFAEAVREKGITM